jgi:hypothetical protein
MFLDQRLALLLKSLMDHCVDGASFLGSKASTLWRQLVRGWFTMWGRPVPYAYEKALDTQELDRKYALVLSDTPEQMEPENIPAGTVMESKVRASTHTNKYKHTKTRAHAYAPARARTHTCTRTQRHTQTQ